MTQIGIIIGSFSISAVISRLYFSNKIGRWKDYTTTFIGLIILNIATLLYLFLDHILTTLILIRVFHGIGFSFFVLGMFSFFATEIDRGIRYQLFLILGIVLMLCGGTMPLVVELILDITNYKVLYIIAFSFSMLSFAFLGILRSANKPARTESYFNISWNKSNIMFCILLFITLCFSHSQASLLNFIGLFLNERNMGMGGIYLWLTLSASVIYSLLLLKNDTKPNMGIGYLLFSLGCLLIASKGDKWEWLFPSAVINGVSMAMLFASLNFYASDFGEDSQKGFFMALFTAVYDTGYITGTVLSGLLLSLMDLKGLFYMVSLIGLVGFLGSRIYLKMARGGMVWLGNRR